MVKASDCVVWEVLVCAWGALCAMEECPRVGVVVVTVSGYRSIFASIAVGNIRSDGVDARRRRYRVSIEVVDRQRVENDRNF